MKRALILAAGLVLIAGIAHAAEPPIVVELTRDQAAAAEALLGFACKASPGTDMVACRGAIGLLDAITKAKAAAAEPKP